MKKSELKQIIREEYKKVLKEMTIKQVEEAMSDARVNKISKLRNGNFKAYFGYHYTNSQTVEQKEELVKKYLPNAEIIDSGDNWAPFKGGAPIQRQSHFWVEFKA